MDTDKTCQVDPQGVQNCILYDTEGKCKRCDVGYYLDTECKESDWISRCLYY